jgi:Mrp family chromosome partitioning ATPase
MTRIFDALRKAGTAGKPAAPAHAVTAPFARTPEAPRTSLPLLGALPLDETVVREMSALRVTLESQLRDRAPRVVMFVGPQGGEGASTVALQFALVLARDVNARPLLVDCHAARPAYEADEARRCVTLSARVTPARSAMPGMLAANLFVLPVTDAQRGASLIQPAALRETLDAQAPGFDWVILDGPPVLEAPDSATLGALADGIVLVLQVGRSKRPVITRAADLLSKAGARTVGSVLNRRVHEIPEFIYRRI